MRRWPKRPLFVALALGLVFAMLASLLTGPSAIGGREFWLWLHPTQSTDAALIIEQLRLPRVLLALMIGGALALCGSVTQGLFRNPLADPSIIGVTSGASLGASLAIVLAASGGSLLGLSLLTLGAFAGGLAASVLVYSLASGRGGSSVATMLLAGIAITALAGAVNNALDYFVDDDMLRRMSLWQMGGLDGANWPRVQLAAVLLLPISVLLWRRAGALNALLLGESEARHLGLPVERLKRELVVLVALAVATAVALAGVIGFVGLVVPHMLRLVIGPEHRALLPAAALAGALLLVLADTLARILVAPAEMPVGVITALIGAPVFVSMLRQRRHYLPT